MRHTKYLVLSVSLFFIAVYFAFAEAPLTRVVQEGIVVWGEDLIEYEPVYNTVIRRVPCGENNASCEEQVYTDIVLNTTVQGEPVYKRGEVDSYIIVGKTIKKHQDRIGCFICPTDQTKQVCYAYDDGFDDHLDEGWQCECKSGTSCKILDPVTEEVSFYRTDGETI